MKWVLILMVRRIFNVMEVIVVDLLGGRSYGKFVRCSSGLATESTDSYLPPPVAIIQLLSVRLLPIIHDLFAV